MIRNDVDDYPVFIIHTLEHALCVAHASVQTQLSVQMFSPRDAANSLGPDVFVSILNQASERYPDANLIGVFDCADTAGSALSAIRRGARHISVQLEHPVYEKIIDIATQSNVSVRNYPENAIDLANTDTPDQTVLNHLLEYEPT